MYLIDEYSESNVVVRANRPVVSTRPGIRLELSFSWRASMMCLILGFLFSASYTYAESRGHYSISYQYIRIDGFEGAAGQRIDIGTTDTHTLLLDLDYALTPRWTASIGLPIVRKRYNGSGPHRLDNLDPPQDSEQIDDGSFRTDVQDLHLGLRYKWYEGRPWSVEPFVGYSFPTHDYAFYGHAAAGQSLWHLEMGATITYVPHFYDFYVRVSPSYVFVEKTLGQSVNHIRLNAAVGYQFSKSVGARIFVMVKEGEGLDNRDFPEGRTTQKWYNHDKMVRHNYMNAGVGVDWNYSQDKAVSLTVMRMIHADIVHIMDYAVSLSFSKSF
jgi:hypothetical protein